MKMVVWLIGLLLISSCNIEPQEINFGTDACHYCSMTIVDNQHAAQLVTHKGRAYKFDAIECMINDIRRREKQQIAITLVNDYSNPGSLIEARSATYVVSDAISSPMGANLSAFINANDAQQLVDSKGGQVYDWQLIQSNLHQ